MLAHFLTVVRKVTRYFKSTGSGTFCAHVAHVVEASHHVAVFVHLT
jgi:hypothetical protein